MRASLAGAKPDATTGGGVALLLDGHPASATTSSASAAATWRRRPIPSVLQRLIDHLLHCRLDLLPLRRGLLQQHEEHVLFGVDHEIATAGAVPFQLAERPRRRRLGVARIGANAKTEPEAETIAGKIEVIARHART